MRAGVKRGAMLAGGWFLIVLGIVGLFLPVLQGVLFLMLGLLVLSSEYLWAHRLLERMKQWFPKVVKRAHATSRRFHNWLHAGGQ